MSGAKHLSDLRGATRLAATAVEGVTDLVQAMHVTIAGGPDVLGRPLEAPARKLTGLVYGSIRGVTRLVGAGIDGALAKLEPLLGDPTAPTASATSGDVEAVLAAVNGILGDYLEATANPLAITMKLRHAGRALDLEAPLVPGATGRILVLVHGSCMNDRQWRRRGHDHGDMLARVAGMTPVYVHYNSGRHVSTNGRELAGLLERLVAAWPVPVDDVTLLAHSMGGLVARSACHAGEVGAHAWRDKLRKLVFLGTPHHGAPLERGGSFIDRLLVVSRYSAPLARLGKIRSAGVTDMRHGNVLDADWSGRDRFAPGADPRTPLPLPAGVASFAIAATTAPTPRPRPPGDGLVPVESALGQHRMAERTLAFPEGHTMVGHGMKHLDLLDHAVVTAALSRWLAPE